MRARLLPVVVALFLAAEASAQPRAVTVVGNGKTDLAGDGGLATRAEARGIGIAIDSRGNIYLGGGTRIRRIDRATGTIDTIAGDHNGPNAFHGGFSGDGGPATAAEFKTTRSIVLRGDDELFLADSENLRVRVIDLKTGIVTTVAGGGTGGPYGTEIGDGSPATGVLLRPAALAFDVEGNLYVAEADWISRIRRVDRRTGLISTIAGNGKKGFSGDGGAAIDATFKGVIAMAFGSDGSLYLSDGGNHCVRKIDTRSGVVSRVVGTGTQGSEGDGGSALMSQLSFPAGIAFNRQGDLFIADTGNDRVRRVDHRTNEISTIARVRMACFAIAEASSSGRAGFALARLSMSAANSSSCQGHSGIAVDSTGALLMSDYSGVLRIDPTAGTTTKVAGGADPSRDSRPALQTSLWRPEGLALDAEGNLFIADTGHRIIRRLDHASGEVKSVQVLADPAVAVPAIPNLKMYDEPSSLAFDSAGALYVVERGKSRVWKIDAGGTIHSVAGAAATAAVGDGGSAEKAAVQAVAVAVDTDGNVYLSDGPHNRIRRVDRENGTITTIAGNGSAGFSGEGTRATQASLNCPRGLAVLGSVFLYVADTANNRVRRIDLKVGTITTVAGTGSAGFSGDGRPAASAQLRAPGAVAVDTDGNLYVADSGNDRIRRIDVSSGVIETLLGPEDGIAYPQGIALDRAGNVLVSNTAKNAVVFIPARVSRP